MPVIGLQEARHQLRKTRALKSGELRGRRPAPDEKVIYNEVFQTPNEEVKEVVITTSVSGEVDIYKSLAFLSGKDKSFDETVQEMLEMSLLVVKRHALYYIRTGMYMYPNTGRYARQKAGQELDKRGNPILPFRQYTGRRYTEFYDSDAGSHPLGRLSGDLYNGVKHQKAGTLRPFSETHSFTMNTTFDTPPYIGWVHDGKEGKTEARPFLSYASETAQYEIMAYLLNRLRNAKLDDYKSIIKAFTINPESQAFGKEADDVEVISKLKKRKGIESLGETMAWWSTDYWG